MGDNFPQLTGNYQAGSRVGGYLLETQIGQGGMAVVFRARDERLDRQVALKILAPALAADEAFRHRFIRESRMAAAVDDPHIIPVYEAGNADGVLFIAMRYVGGGDVRSLLYRTGALDPVRVAAIVSPIASALDTAHAAGLVHRDVKPANILLDIRPGRPDHVYLSDFGLSKEALGATGLTAANQFLGTVDYAAPEQAAGKAVGGAADQYALGCAAFEMLTGEPPFRRDQPMAVLYAHLSEPPPAVTDRRPGLPAALDPVFDRVLAKSPSDRYQNCAAFTSALRQATGLTPYDAAERAARPATEIAGPVVAGAAEATGAAWTGGARAPGGAGGVSGTGAGGVIGGLGATGAGAGVGGPFIPGLYPQGGGGPLGAGLPGPTTEARQQRRWPLILASAVGTAAVLAIAYSVVLFLGHSTHTTLAGNSPTATSSSSPPPVTPSPSPTSSPSGRSTSGDDSSPDEVPVTPSTGTGGTRYQDAEGFTVQLPVGWAYSSAQRSGDYPEVHFAGRSTGSDLEISWSKITGPSALGSWQQLDAMHAQNVPSYQRIALHQVNYRGYDAAVWEFTEVHDGITMHYLDWGFVVKPDVLGYAILLDAPEADWLAVYSSTWTSILNSFQPGQ